MSITASMDDITQTEIDSAKRIVTVYGLRKKPKKNEDGEKPFWHFEYTTRLYLLLTITVISQFKALQTPSFLLFFHHISILQLQRQFGNPNFCQKFYKFSH